MTISATTARADYPGAGSVGPFAFPFKVNVVGDLAVIQRSAAGAETTLAYPTDFSITGLGDAAGGSVTLTTALPVGQTLTLVRALDVVQPTDIRNQGAYFPATIEDALDRLVMVDQMQQDAVDRSMKLTASLDPALYDLTVGVPTAGKVLTGTGTGVDWTTLDTSATSLPGSGRTTATLSAFLANNLGREFDPMDFSAVGDDSADDTAAVQAALDAAASVSPAGTVVIRRKHKVVAGAVNVPGATGHYALLMTPTHNGVTVRCEGAGQLRCATDGATVLAVAGTSSAVHVKDVSLAVKIVGGDSTNNGLGRGVFFFRADRCTLKDSDISAVRLGVQVDRVSTDGAYCSGNRISRVTVRDTVGTTTGNGTGFFASGVDGLTLEAIQSLNVAEHGVYISQDSKNVTLDGAVLQPSGSANQNAGVQVYTSVATPNMSGITLSGVVVKGGKWGVVASAAGGGAVTQLSIVGGSISGCLTNGVVLSNVQESTLTGVTVTGTTAGSGIELDVCRSVQVVGCTSSTNGKHGLVMVTSTDCTVLGGAYLNNDQTATTCYGIFFSTTATGNKVIGAVCTDYQGVKTQKYGIVGDASSTGLLIHGCTVSGNVTGTISIAGTSGTRIFANPGYNPAGQANITVTASPFTYTAGTSPEVVSVMGGTVSAIAKNGTNIATTTNQQVPLSPGQPVTVTYTVAPTMVKDIA